MEIGVSLITLGLQHLVLAFVPETIDNALVSMDRFARAVRPALG
jgi:hypothetical protein